MCELRERDGTISKMEYNTFVQVGWRGGEAKGCDIVI